VSGPGQGEYLDFDVHIGTREGASYPTRVRSPAGEPRGEFTMPFDGPELEATNARLAVLRQRAASERRQAVREPAQGVASEGLPRTVGAALFKSLLGGPLESGYRVSRDRARRDGKGLRLLLRIDAPEVAALPWELLYDDVEGDFIALARETPVVRYVELNRPPTAIPISQPPLILGMVAAPKGLATLNVDAEMQRIQEEIGDVASLQWVKGQSWRDLQRAIRDAPWNVFHFIGHGSAQLEGGSIILEDDAGEPAPLPAEELGRLLAGQPSIGLVVLNSCEGARGNRGDAFSSVAATLVRRGLPAVIAMQHEVSDRSAVSFAREFYAAVAGGLPVDAALGEARIASSVESRQSAEWATPVLLMRAPNGQLFDMGDSATATARLPLPAPDDSDFPELPGLSVRGWYVTLALIAVVVIALVGFLVATA
jgi:hypothetical protein